MGGGIKKGEERGEDCSRGENGVWGKRMGLEWKEGKEKK